MSSQRAVTGWPPLWLKAVAPADIKRGDGQHAVKWIEGLCRCTEDSIAALAGELLQLRRWQQEVIAHLLARRGDGRLLHRQALIGLGRKNGKSSLSAGIGLYGLLSDYPAGPQGREVFSCAGDKEQARIVFGTARKMIELEPELNEVTKLYKDAIEIPATGSIYRVLSAEAFSKEGLNPTLVIFDEVHVQPNRELWDVMANAMGARPEPLMVGITTAGLRFDSTGRDSLCYQMYQHGKRVVTGEVEDPSFFFAWWEPSDPDADFRARETWIQANPGLGDIVSEEDMQTVLLRTPESEFRTKRCNQWVMSAQPWLPYGAWQACGPGENELAPQVGDGAAVVLGFDGSFNNDCTALVLCTVTSRPLLKVVELWEKPDDDTWRVPIEDVEDSIRAACRRWSVREIDCDPARWARSYQILQAEGLPVAEFPQTPARMTPATQQFYEAVVNKQLEHDGDPRMARHVANAILKRDSRGMRIVKEHTHSRRRIDLAVASLMAYSRATWWYGQEESEPLIAIGSSWGGG
jgi:phage terminase large subunit-like protein